ncbi:Pycsar system effector family protein [Sorangium sp. So ce388]|uniref:Pycsar system effector family protein n=1 Tax=Sorangium sp. So ce388 TaxID=3133309 RepID=UPI003F5B8BA9
MSEKFVDVSDFPSKTNAYLTEYIKFADAKAGAILVFITLVGAVVSATSERMLSAVRTAGWGAFALGAIAAVAILVSVTMALWHTAVALSPRTSNANKSLHSFPDIVKMQLEDYLSSVLVLTPESIANNYSIHNYALAKIAMAKYECIGRAMRALRVALLAAFAVALLFVVASASSASTTAATDTSKTQSGIGTKSSNL